MRNIIDSEPSNFEEAVGQQVWKDAMMKEYQSIMTNDVLDIVLTPKRMSVVNSKWIYNINHTIYGSINKHKESFIEIGFSQKGRVDY